MSIVGFGVNKPVPVNLLMMALLCGGLVLGLSLRREFFPEIDPNKALITILYPGATPEEVEKSLAAKVEDKLAGLDEVKELRSTLSEGGGGIMVEFHEGVDVDKALDEIERSVDALIDLPEESETIQVRLFEPRLPVIRVTVFGDLDEYVMKQAIRGVRDDLRSLPGMGEILVSGVRDYELRVEVHGKALLEYGISLPEVADRIGAWMADIPGGTVRSKTGNVKIRTVGVAERGRAVRDIVVRADPQGRAVRVGDIAEVTESFVDEQLINRFNGKPSASLTVFKIGDQDIVKIAEMVRAYVAGRNGQAFGPRGLERVASWGLGQKVTESLTSDRQWAWELGWTSTRPLPPGAELQTSSDLARFVEGRLDLLLRNARYGAILVFLTLLMFLNLRLALWVGVGLVTALSGTLVLMAWADVTLNLLTMFGLILVMGLLVDDAIVVSENIQTRHDRGEPSLVAAVRGTEQVLWPVVATVLTSVVAFLPLTFIKGHIGDLLGALPLVVACALLMSLVESVLILPSHIGHSLARRAQSQPRRLVHVARRAERWRDHIVFERLVPLYGRVLSAALAHRYTSIALAVAILIVSIGMVKSGRSQFTFLPTTDSETIIVDLHMPIGTSIDKTNHAVAEVERAAQAQEEFKNVASIIGQIENLESGAVEAFAPHVAQMFIELKFVEQRERESSQVIQSIRDALAGKLEEAERITFSEITGGPGGADISIEVRARAALADQMDAAVSDLKMLLGGFAGVHDISDNNDVGQIELQINVRAQDAESIGLTQRDVARQIRGFLYGLDAHVFVAEQEDIDVRVRLDEETRRSLFEIENSWLIGPGGRAIPLSEIADVTEQSTYSTINRTNGARAVTVTAATDPAVSPEQIVARLTQPPMRSSGWFGLGGAKAGSSPIEQLRQRYRGIEIRFTGRQQQMKDAFASLPYGLGAAVMMIFVILAFLFSSYSQPLLIILVVPFAVIGVVWGHILLGYDLTFLSLIGFVALSGIVVNDSLILVCFFNSQRALGLDKFDSLMAAGRARFRAILLTTITTVLGLTPLILEQSFQAKFLIPMAISIAGGLISATGVVLIVLPCIILVSDDLKALARLLWHGRPAAQATEPDTGETA